MLYKVKNPSLEINWLPNSFLKGLNSVQIIFSDYHDISGAYYHIQDYEFDEYEISLTKQALIIVNPNYDGIAATLAHEMRHHQQYYMIGDVEYAEYSAVGDYRTNMVAFFKSSWRERDALFFENKVAPHHTGLEWESWIRDDYKSTMKLMK